MTSFAFADQDARNLAEKTFTRDNTFCRFGKKSVEIQIRSSAKFTEPKEAGYGEHFFFYPEDNEDEGERKPHLLPLNHHGMDSYRLFDGSGSQCSKSLGFMLDKTTLAVLFLRENRPEHDKLSFQLFDINTLQAGRSIDTELETDKAEMAPNGFAFRSYTERPNIGMGTITLNGQKYTFQDRQFPFWVKYTATGFEILNDITYKRFPWKGLFKDDKDFMTMTGWDAKEKKFLNRILYYAINHQLRKECVLFSSEKLKLTGTEANWRCN